MRGETRLSMSAARESMLIGESGPSLPDNGAEPTEDSAASAAVWIKICRLRFDGDYLTSGEP